MEVLALLLLVLFTAVLVLVLSMSPRRSHLSQFERERRASSKVATVILAIRRERHLVEIRSLQYVACVVFVVLVSLLSVAQFGWLLGTVVAIIIALGHGPLSRWAIVHRRAQAIYDHYEQSLLNFIEKHHRNLRMIKMHLPTEAHFNTPHSREELAHIIDKAAGLLSTEEVALMAHSLEFTRRRVCDVMITRDKIDSIDKAELLGPLVLNDLHETGHSRFPVTDGDLDRCIGILDARELRSLDSKRSLTAQKAMEARVYFIHEQQTLPEALVAFVSTRHHLFIVVNDQQRTVGLLSLDDVVTALVGYPLVDRYDTHDSLRAVADRQATSAKHSPGSADS